MKQWWILEIVVSNYLHRLQCCSTSYEHSLLPIALAGPPSRLVYTYVAATMTIILALYHLVLEVLSIFFGIYSITSYFKDIRNHFELAVYFSSIIFVFNYANECGCPTQWQWQVGIFVLFLGWISLLFFSSGFPLTALYAIIFGHILKTFLFLAMFATVIVMGFSVILFMMFNNPDAGVSLNCTSFVEFQSCLHCIQLPCQYNDWIVVQHFALSEHWDLPSHDLLFSVVYSFWVCHCYSSNSLVSYPRFLPFQTSVFPTWRQLLCSREN